jgi:competence protein ComEA
VRYRSGTTLLVIVLLAWTVLEWSRPLLRPREAPPAPAVSAPYALQLGPGFPAPGVHQFSDAQSPRSVIEMTNLEMVSELRADPCLDIPLVSGAALDIQVKDAEIQDVFISWMPAGQRLALGMSLHPDRMERRDWELLPGIGPTLAQRIDLDRQENGDFGSFEGVQRVRGVGKKRIAAWKEFFEK